MAEKNNAFHEMLNRYCSNGIFKKVYSSDTAIVCNVFNQMYVAFNLKIMEKYSQNFPGFTMNSKGLKNVIEDENFINYYFSSLTPEEQNSALMVLDEGFFQHMNAHKTEFARLPVRSDIDLSYEQQVVEMQVKQDEMAIMFAEQQAQSLAAVQQKGVPLQNKI